MPKSVRMGLVNAVMFDNFCGSLSYCISFSGAYRGRRAEAIDRPYAGSIIVDLVLIAGIVAVF